MAYNPDYIAQYPELFRDEKFYSQSIASMLEEMRRETTPHVVRYFRYIGKTCHTPPSEIWFGGESDCVWIVPGTGQ